jgi:hypothetical protein
MIWLRVKVEPESTLQVLQWLDKGISQRHQHNITYARAMQQRYAKKITQMTGNYSPKNVLLLVLLQLGAPLRLSAMATTLERRHIVSTN